MNKRKKHIVFCSTSFFEYDRRLQRIIRTLKENDFTISWISRSYLNDTNAILYVNNIILNPLFKSGILFYCEIMLRFFFKLLTNPYDIIYSVDTDTVLPCLVVSKLRKKKIVFDSHEIFHEVPELIDKPLKKSIWIYLSKFTFPRIRNKITVNNSLKTVFEKQFKTQFSVIRNVPDLIETNNKLPNYNSKTLVYLGVLNKGRGVELAIASLIKLRDYKLVLIGEGDLISNFKMLAQENGVSDRVDFLGYQDPRKLSSFLGKSSIGLNLLMPASENYRLSLANKFFDYMHAGLPSINMNYPEYKTINDKYDISVLINSYDTNDLISAIEKLESKEYFTHLQQNNVKASKVFNWQKESQKLIQLFENL